MATKPTKLVQITAPPVAETSRLPVTRGSDGRSGVQGATGPFVVGGVVGGGLPLARIVDPGVAAITLTPDQLCGGIFAISPIAANLAINFPTAAAIVSYLGSDLVRVAPGAAPTNGNALTAQAYTAASGIYESFDFFIDVYDASFTFTFGAANAAASTTKTFFYGGGLFNNAAALTVAANTRTRLHFKVLVVNSTPGSEMVWIIPVSVN